VDNAWVGDSRQFIFFSLACFRLFRDAPHSRFRCRNLKLCSVDFLKMLDLAFFKSTDVYFTCEVYRFGHYLGKKLSPISTFFSLVNSRAFTDAPHSRFMCRDPNQCLPNFLKILLLTLSQIYTRVFHLWKFIDLDSAWVRDYRLYQFLFASKFSRV